MGPDGELVPFNIVIKYIPNPEPADEEQDVPDNNDDDPAPDQDAEPEEPTPVVVPDPPVTVEAYYEVEFGPNFPLTVDSGVVTWNDLKAEAIEDDFVST